ncbi:MAG: RNA methyltransferase [Candidatus Azobacteroides pseudotrichonymphae]|jgi:tRNA G18 (ribose-2'-O)-methylase SpoU|uniref:rRNA methyltransferase n=1 Tax=Azobacteroides pseudotrichonymphae genomovar. CFP2 TaxID=511995 RepID=B6YQV0_AZOPC|nr:RNA methyltransferase [Candidatus Azobacteroides pseudotrichonymphae]BAG83572.1 putative rRNA methyltransferase [Candidatus Azobacteroides pseudotrichonymphae genomovar. CFP2]GMO32545.1 MAG: RNA methyltransferase [Candidatus Azobacteroides pseudotrichonymphae]
MRKLKITELNRISKEDFKEVKKNPLVVVLDNIRSLNNVGSVFRTCDAFRVETVYLCGITAIPPNVEIHKTALGAEDSVNWKYSPITLRIVEELHQKGYQIIAVEQAEESIMLDEFQSKYSKQAIILGNEVHGIDQEVMNQCDACIEIPQFGTKHSLNVSITAGIVIWEITKNSFIRKNGF